MIFDQRQWTPTPLPKEDADGCCPLCGGSVPEGRRFCRKQHRRIATTYKRAWGAFVRSSEGPRPIVDFAHALKLPIDDRRVWVALEALAKKDRVHVYVGANGVTAWSYPKRNGS